MAPARGKILSITAAATLALGYGAWLFFESFLAPPGCCGAVWPLPNPLQAERLVRQRDPSDTNGVLQRQAALEITRGRPGDIEGWMRLAYANRLLHGRLTAEGDHALDVSYSITPYGGVRAVWRVMFVLDNWTDASPRVRQDALAEIKIIKTDPDSKWALQHQTPTLHDVHGRATAILFGVLPVAGLNIR